MSISIIMPAYNSESYIEEAIESVLMQKELPKELIIVNDGSTDGTLEIIKKYESNPIIKIFSKKNEGLGITRNYGAARAMGSYIYFFDSDDILSDGFTIVIKAMLLKSNFPDLIMFSGKSFVDEGADFDTCQFPDYDRKIDCLLSRDDHPNSQLYAVKGYFSSACLYVVNRKYWNNNNFCFKNIIHEDQEIIFPLIAKAERVLVTRDVLFYRRIRNNSIMTTKVTSKNMDGIKETLNSLLGLNKSDIPCFDNLAYRRRIREFFYKYVLIGRETRSIPPLTSVFNISLKARMPFLFIAYIYLLLPNNIKSIIRKFKNKE